jgi:hypothetical protein
MTTAAASAETRCDQSTRFHTFLPAHAPTAKSAERWWEQKVGLFRYSVIVLVLDHRQHQARRHAIVLFVLALNDHARIGESMHQYSVGAAISASETPPSRGRCSGSNSACRGSFQSNGSRSKSKSGREGCLRPPSIGFLLGYRPYSSQS